MELRLETVDTAWLRRSLTADLRVRADGSVWLDRTLGNVEEGALRTKLGIQPKARMQEDLFLRVVGGEHGLSLSYDSSFARDSGVQGTGGCVLSTMPGPEPLPAL